MTHRDIVDRRRELDRIRREQISRVVSEHHEKYQEEYSRLEGACQEIGHIWKFTNFGPVGDPWYCCGACGSSIRGPIAGL